MPGIVLRALIYLYMIHNAGWLGVCFCWVIVVFLLRFSIQLFLLRRIVEWSIYMILQLVMCWLAVRWWWRNDHSSGHVLDFTAR